MITDLLNFYFNGKSTDTDDTQFICKPTIAFPMRARTRALSRRDGSAVRERICFFFSFLMRLMRYPSFDVIIVSPLRRCSVYMYVHKLISFVIIARTDINGIFFFFLQEIHVFHCSTLDSFLPDIHLRVCA